MIKSEVESINIEELLFLKLEIKLMTKPVLTNKVVLHEALPSLELC